MIIGNPAVFRKNICNKLIPIIGDDVKSINLEKAILISKKNGAKGIDTGTQLL